MPDLKGMLTALSKIQKASGASAEAKATMSLASLANDNLAVEIEALDLVEFFVGELETSRGNRVHFDQVMKDMRKPSLLTEAQAKAIARQYLQTKATFRNKATALEAIRDARAGEERLKAKIEAS